MATISADISDLVSPMKIEADDKELNSGSSRIAPKKLISVEEKVESTSVPLFETTKVENSNDIADVHVINEGIAKAVEGDNFLNSPSVFYEELEQIPKKDQLNSIERVNGSQTGEEIDIKTNENSTRLVIEPTDCSQGTSLDIERVRDVIPIMEKRDDILATDATLSQQVSTEINFTGEDDSQNKNLESLLTEKAKEEIGSFEISKHESDHVVKDITEENLEDNTDILAKKCELDEPLELDHSFTHKNETAIKNVEMLVTEASEKIEITPSTETPDQIPIKEEAETTNSGDAILVENPEEKNLAASGLDKNNGATSDDLNATSLLVEEELQIISEKPNIAPIVETEQVDKKDDELITKEEELDEHEITNQTENVEEEVKNETPTQLVPECYCEKTEITGETGDKEEPNEPSKILDVEKVRYDGPIEEKGGDTLSTEAALSQLDSTETSFKGEDESLNKSSESHLTETVDDEVDKSKQEPDHLTIKCEHEVAMVVTDVEKPVTEASEEVEITPSSETRDQISAEEDETTISGEINVLATPEEENLTAEVAVTDESGNNSNATSLVEEELQITSEKTNQDSISEGPEDEQECKSSVELIQTANHFDKNAYDQIIKEEEFKEPEITNKREDIEDVKNEILLEHTTDSNCKEMTSWDQGNETAEKVGDQEEPEEPSTLKEPKNKIVNDTEKSEDVSSLIFQASAEEIKEGNTEDIEKSVEKADTEVKQIVVPIETENEVLESEINLDRESESNVKNVKDVYKTTTSLCVEESGASEIQNGEHGESETKTQIEEGKGLEGFDAVPESENRNFEEIHETKTSASEINSEEISEINEAENLGSKKNLDEEVKEIDQYPVSGQTPAEKEREEVKPVTETENGDDKIQDEITQQNETTVTKPDANEVKEETNYKLIPEPHVKFVEEDDEIDSAKENIEISKQASEEIEISPTSELLDQNPAKEDKTPISGDVIELATPEENNLIAIDLDEKNGEAEVAVTDNTGDESIFSSPLLEEDVQNINEKLDQDSKLETQIQVLEESEDPEGTQFVKKEEFEEPEIIKKSENVEKDVNKETPTGHATECNDEDTTTCTQENTVAKIDDGKEPEESSTLEEPENIMENGTEKTDDVSSLVSQTKDAENYEEKAETNTKQINDPLEETSIMKPQLGEHDIEKEDLERAKSLENESESSVKNVQDVYETTTSPSVEESGAEEIENIIREVPKEISEENDENKTEFPIEHKTVEGSDAVPESEDLTVEEICVTKTSTNEKNYEEVLGNNENETLEAEREPDLHASKEIEEIPKEEEKEEPNQFRELGNIVDKVENESTDKTETEVTNHEANEVTEETNSGNPEIQPEIQPVKENDDIEPKPHVKETEAGKENEETNNDEFITPTLANEELSSKEFQQNGEPGNITDYVSSSESIDTHEKEDISQQVEGVEKIDLQDDSTAVSVNMHENEERESEIAKVDDEVEDVSSPLTISEPKDQVIEDAVETDLSSTVHESGINEASKIEKEIPEKLPEVCGSNDQSFRETREMETEPISEITKNYKMEEQTKEATISKSIEEPNVIGIEETSENEPTPTAGDIQAEEERADVEERENELSSKIDTEVMSLYDDEVQELRASEPVTQIYDEKKDELDPTPAVGKTSKDEIEETDVETVQKIDTRFNEDMADLIDMGTAENAAQKELEILNPDATMEYTENKETEKQTNEKIIEGTKKCNEVVTLFRDSESINEPIPTNATSSVNITPETIERVDTSEIDKINLEETSTVEFQVQEHENETEVSESFTANKRDTENVEVEKPEVPAVTDQVYEADIHDEVAHNQDIQNGSKVEHESKTIRTENEEDGHMKNDNIEENNLNLQEVSQLQNIESVRKSDADVVQAEESTGFTELKAEISGGKGKKEETKIIAEKISATTLDTGAVVDDEANESPHTLGKEEDHQELSSELLSEITNENEDFRISETKTESNILNVEEVNDDEANEQHLITGKSEGEYQETSSVLLSEKKDENEGSEVSETKREANVVGIEEPHDEETNVAKELFSTSVEDHQLTVGEFEEQHQPSSALLSEKQDANEEIEICYTKIEPSVHGRDTTTDVEKTRAEKVEEETKEDLKTLPEPKGQDISEIEIPETKETVDSINFEETSIIESKLQEHENEEEAFETVTAEITDLNDVEVDNKKNLQADSESLGFENKGPKAVSNDEISPSWTSQADNNEEEIQNSCSAFPSSERNHENVVTNTTTNTEDELEPEEVPKALPEGETQGPDVVITDEISCSCTSKIENNKDEVLESSYVFVSSDESHETTSKTTEDDSNGEITRGCTSQADNKKEEVPESSSVLLSSEESKEDECEKVTQEVPKALPEGKTQGPEDAINDEITPSWTSQAENCEEEVSNIMKEAVVSKSISECEALNCEVIGIETHTEIGEDETNSVVETTCEPEHEDAADIIARYIIFNQTFPDENKEEVVMGVKETDDLPAAESKEGSVREQVSVVVRESGEGSMGEIYPIEEVIKASGGKIEEKGFEIVPESKDQSFEEARDTKKIMATEFSNIDKVDGSNLMEKIHGETYSILENESKKQQIEPWSAMLRDQDAFEDGMIKPEEINKNIAMSHENVFDLSEEGTTVENMLSKPVDEKCTETGDLEFEKIEKSFQPESEILGSMVSPTEKVTNNVDEILEEPTANMGESETHTGNTIEAAQAIQEINSKESLAEEPEKAETNNTLKESTTKIPAQVSTANANYAEKENDKKYMENEPITENKGDGYGDLATETTMSTKEVDSFDVTMEDPEEKIVDCNDEDETAVTKTINNIEEYDIKENVVIEEQESKTNALDFPSKKATADEIVEAAKAEIMVDKEQSDLISDTVSITPNIEEQVEKLEPNEIMKEPLEEKKISRSSSQKQIAIKEYSNEEKENQNAIVSREFQVKSEDSTSEKQVECFEDGKHAEESQAPKNPAEVTEESKTEAEEKALVEEEKTDEETEDDHKKTDSGSDAPVMVEASRDIDVKTPQKKSHNILSGVGSKVKHSLAKVKKVITGKSSHQRASSPKEDKKAESVPLL